MEEKKLNIDGEHFAKVLDSEIKAVIGRVEKARKALNGKAKRNPLLNLIDSGRLTKEYVLAEMKKLQDKTSTLPSGERAVLRDIIGTAVRRTAIEQAEAQLAEAKEKLDKKEKAVKAKTAKAKTKKG